MDSPQSIRSVGHFLDEVTKVADDDDVLFRGHRSSQWELIPTLGRVPLRQGSTLETEGRLVRAFKAQALPHLQRELKDEWDTLAMAQHHGMATRLLDWTSNPLVALWFAVREPPLEKTPGIVHAFVAQESDFAEREISSPYEVKKTKIFRPSHLNSRIVVQSGWFSVHRFNDQTQRLSALGRVGAFRDRLIRFRVASSRFSDLRSQLDRVGINQASLFPDLDGLSHHLNWLNFLLRDEH